MTSCAPSDRILQSVLTRVPGVTEALVSVELFNTIDEHLRRTNAWKHVAPVQLEEGVSEYDLMLPADSAFVRMMWVTLNALPVPSAQQGTGSIQSSVGAIPPELTFPDGDSRYIPTVTDLAAGVFSYVIYRPSFIVVTPPTVEQARQPFEAVMSLTIAPGCIECSCGDWGLEEWMYEMFFQDWLDGTLMKLFTMPNKPWANEKAALYHGRRFRTAMGFRMQEARRGFVYNVPGWRYPRVGGWVR